MTLRTDFMRFLDERGSNFRHPTNQFLLSAFRSIRHTDNEDYDEWAFVSAQTLEGIYFTNLSRYISRSEGYRLARQANGDRPSSLRWLLNNISWYGFTTGLGQKPRESISVRGIQRRIRRVEGAAEMIRDVCLHNGPNGPISFCSKYAFFMNNVTPIFDARAANALCMIDGRRALQVPYREYVDRFTEVLERIFPRKQEFTPKDLKDVDGYLWAVGRGAWEIQSLE